MSENRILIMSHDVVGSKMAGPGIRYWEMARALADEHPVTLLAPRPVDLPTGKVRCGVYTPGEPGTLAPWLAEADVVVANGILVGTNPELAHTPLPLALDLYDPTPLENLELLRRADLTERTRQTLIDLDLLRRQLLVGDCLLCATERQRDLYIGALLAAGRLRPALVDSDLLLRRLLKVVPFGLPADPLPPLRPALRGLLPGVDESSLIVLWSGGLWDWMDPLTLIYAVQHLVGEFPNLRLVFLAGAHPGLARPPAIAGAARSLAGSLGLLGNSIHFYDQWVPYERRADFLREADLLAYLHGEHLESAYAAVRSRFLDHLWVGRPSLVSAGDAAAELVERHQLGRTVPTGDIAAVVEALRALLVNEEERVACGQQAWALADSYTWSRVLEPLREFCRSPYTMIDKPEPLPIVPPPPQNEPAAADSAGGEEPVAPPPEPAAAPAAPVANDEVPVLPLLHPEVQAARDARNAAVAALDTLWNVQPRELTSGVPLVGKAKQAANSLTRWYVQAIIEQQNSFNAALVRAVQQLAEADDRRYGGAINTAGQLQQELSSTNLRIDGLGPQFANIIREIENLRNYGDGLSTQIAQLARQMTLLDNQMTIISQQLQLQTQWMTNLQSEWMANVSGSLRGLQQQTDTIEDDLAQLRRESAPLHQHVADIEQHLCDIDDAQTELAKQLSNLASASEIQPS